MPPIVTPAAAGRKPRSGQSAVSYTRKTRKKSQSLNQKVV